MFFGRCNVFPLKSYLRAQFVAIAGVSYLSFATTLKVIPIRTGFWVGISARWSLILAKYYGSSISYNILRSTVNASFIVTLYMSNGSMSARNGGWSIVATHARLGPLSKTLHSDQTLKYSTVQKYDGQLI
jgi:hypothetical protein